MSEERPRQGGLFDVDLGGGTPLPDVQRVRKPTVALDGGPGHPPHGGPMGPAHPTSPTTPLSAGGPEIVGRAPAGASHGGVAPGPSGVAPRPTEGRARGEPSAHPVRPSHVPPPLPERTVVVAPDMEVSEHSATPDTRDPLGGAAWQGAGNEDSELADLTEEDLSGTVVASHRLESRLGGGGFADVYLGRHEFLARTSAVKLLRRSLAASETTRRRFQREAEVLAALGHPNVVRLIDYGVLPSGRPFLVTELVDGRTLRARLDSGEPIPPELALEWTKQLARGLAALHALGVVHRDLKPTNVMVSGATNDLKILDLGIARWLEPGDRTRLTEAGRLLGTPKYSAPEQLLDPASAGPPADLYALGSILYEMLAGRAPFWGGDRADVIEEKSARPPPPPPGHTGLEPIAVALLEPNPNKRIGTAAELLARLDEAQLGVVTKVLPAPADTRIIATSGVASMPGTPVLVPSAHPGTLRTGGSRVWLLAGAAAVLAFAVGVGTTFLVLRGPGGDAVEVPAVDEAGSAPAAIAARAAPAAIAPTADDPAPSAAAVDPRSAESSARDDAEDDEARRVARRTPRPQPRRTTAPARAVAEPSRAMTARGDVDGALAARGLTALDLARLVDEGVLRRWRDALGSGDDAQIDGSTRGLVRAIQDAPITTAVIDGQIRRVLAATQGTSLPQPTVQKIEDRCFELRRDLAGATAARREEIAREVTSLERRLRAP